MSWLYQPVLPASLLTGAAITGAAAQTLSFGQSAAGKIGIGGAAAQTLAFSQSAAGKIGIGGAAAQTLSFNQSASGVISIVGAAAQTLAFSQSAAGAVTIGGAAAQTLSFSQSASGVVMAGAAAIWLAVHEAVYIAITAAVSGIADVYDSVPHNASYPYVDLAAQNRRANDTLSSYGYSFTFYPAIYSQHLGPREVRTIMGLINLALHNANLTLTIGHSVRCRVTEEKCLREPDGRTYQGGMTIELFVVI